MQIPIFLYLQSLIKWLAIALLSLLVVPLLLFPLALLGPHSSFARTLFYKVSSWFCRCIIAITRIKLVITGALEVLHKEPAIIVMNHSSSLDIPLLEALMAGAPFVWLSKASYKKIPIGGIILNRMHASVDRQHAVQAAKSLDFFVAKATRFQAHMLMFPEGTRYVDGNIHPFKPGFAVAAEQTNRLVIPIVVKNMHAILPKHGLLIDSSHKTIKIIVGEPLQRIPDESREAFVQRVQSTCASLLSKAL